MDFYIEVGVAIVIRENKVLLGKRSNNVPFTGFWEFPGGKLEKNETPQEAIVRELKEELNVESNVNHLLFEYKIKINEKFYKLHCYYTDIDDNKLELRVHDEIEWVSLEKADSYKLLKTNYKILKRIIEDKNRNLYSK